MFFRYCSYIVFFFFNDTATTEIYTLSLHDALPICHRDLLLVGPDGPPDHHRGGRVPAGQQQVPRVDELLADRKSTRLNSSHGYISYAVFCLKKKKKEKQKTSEDNRPEAFACTYQMY